MSDVESQPELSPLDTAKLGGIGRRFSAGSIRKARARAGEIRKLRATIESMTCVLVDNQGVLRDAESIHRIVQTDYDPHHFEALMFFGTDATVDTIKRDLQAMHRSLVDAGDV